MQFAVTFASACLGAAAVAVSLPDKKNKKATWVLLGTAIISGGIGYVWARQSKGTRAEIQTFKGGKVKQNHPTGAASEEEHPVKKARDWNGGQTKLRSPTTLEDLVKDVTALLTNDDFSNTATLLVQWKEPATPGMYEAMKAMLCASSLPPATCCLRLLPCLATCSKGGPKNRQHAGKVNLLQARLVDALSAISLHASTTSPPSSKSNWRNQAFIVSLDDLAEVHRLLPSLAAKTAARLCRIFELESEVCVAHALQLLDAGKATDCCRFVTEGMALHGRAAGGRTPKHRQLENDDERAKEDEQVTFRFPEHMLREMLQSLVDSDKVALAFTFVDLYGQLSNRRKKQTNKQGEERVNEEGNAVGEDMARWLIESVAETDSKLAARKVKAFGFDMKQFPLVERGQRRKALGWVIHSANALELASGVCGGDAVLQRKALFLILKDKDTGDMQVEAFLTLAREFGLEDDEELAPSVQHFQSIYPAWKAEQEAKAQERSTRFLKSEPPQGVLFVDDAASLEKARQILTGDEVQVLGLDAENIADLGVGSSQAALLQVACRSHVFLFDLIFFARQKSTGNPESVGDAFTALMNSLLLSPSLIKLGYGFADDMKQLRKGHSALMKAAFTGIRSLLDLNKTEKTYAKLINLFPDEVPRADGDNPKKKKKQVRGLSRLCRACLGKPLCKDNQMSDWGRRPLRKDQVAYAALDAWCLIGIYDTLLDMEAKATTQPPPLMDFVSDNVTR